MYWTERGTSINDVERFCACCGSAMQSAASMPPAAAATETEIRSAFKFDLRFQPTSGALTEAWPVQPAIVWRQI